MQVLAIYPRSEIRDWRFEIRSHPISSDGAGRVGGNKPSQVSSSPGFNIFLQLFIFPAIVAAAERQFRQLATLPPLHTHTHICAYVREIIFPAFPFYFVAHAGAEKSADKSQIAYSRSC